MSVCKHLVVKLIVSLALLLHKLSRFKIVSYEYSMKRVSQKLLMKSKIDKSKIDLVMTIRN